MAGGCSRGERRLGDHHCLQSLAFKLWPTILLCRNVLQSACFQYNRRMFTNPMEASTGTSGRQ